MKKFFILLLFFVLIIAVFILKTMSDAGQFKQIEPHFDGKVRVIKGVTGGEDITIDHARQVAYISADDRFARIVKKKQGFGGIYSLDLNTPGSIPVLMQRTPDDVIYPHGISLFHSPSGKIYLYVVDHADNSHAILLYSLQENDNWQLENKWEDETYMISPNDVLGVDENRFYFTNDHGSRSEPGKMLEDFLQLKKSNVVYFDGNAFSVAAGKIAYANGINMSRDGNELYVASPVEKCVHVYNREAASGVLTFQQTIELNTGVDNIELDEKGNLWVGCHPRLLTFLKHAADTSKPAPSQVLKIAKDDSGNFNYEEIYLNKGEQISASSVAAVSGKHLLIGPVFHDRILWCALP